MDDLTWINDFSFNVKNNLATVARPRSLKELNTWPGKDPMSGEEYQPGENIKLEPYHFYGCQYKYSSRKARRMCSLELLVKLHGSLK